MYKLKKGISLFSSDHHKIISVLLESINLKKMTKIYCRMAKLFLMNNFNKIRNRNSKTLDHNSMNIADFLNTEYENYSDDSYETTDSFLKLLKLHYKKYGAYTFNNLYYSIIHAPSSLYLLPEDITPAKKADLISKHTYITVLENLRIILQSTPEHQLRIIETTLDSLILEKEKSEQVGMRKLFQLEQLTDKKILELLMKESFINQVTERDHTPKLLIEIVNRILSTLCTKNKKFTQVNSNLKTFILFQIDGEIYWILEISPHLMMKGSKHIAKETAAMLIFLSKVLLDETYLPLDHELPSFNLTLKGKNTLLKRNARFKSISFQLNDNRKQLKILEDQLVQGMIHRKNLSYDKNECEEAIILNKKQLITLKNTLTQSEEKLKRLLKRYDVLESKQSNTPRVKEKLISLSSSCDALKKEIEILNEEINNSKNIIYEKKNLKSQLGAKLVNNNRKLKETKIEVALLKKQIESYEQEKYQLETSNVIYFSVHWGRSFNAFRIPSKVYDALLNFNIKSLLLIERILVELNESSTPDAVGQKVKEKENTYIVSVKKGDKLLCRIQYKADNEKNIILNIL